MPALWMVNIKSIHSKLCGSASLREASLSYPLHTVSVFNPRAETQRRRGVFLRECLFGDGCGSDRAVDGGHEKHSFQTLRLCARFLFPTLCARLLNSIIAQRRRGAEGGAAK
jgi:hypothetical protein